MEPRKNSKLIKVLAEISDSPGQFIRTLCCIKDLSSAKLAKLLGTSEAYIIMVWNNKSGLGSKATIKFANALSIDPYLLGRLVSDYNIEQCLKEPTEN